MLNLEVYLERFRENLERIIAVLSFLSYSSQKVSCLFRFSVIFLNSVQQFSAHKSYISFVKFIPTYFDFDWNFLKCSFHIVIEFFIRILNYFHCFCCSLFPSVFQIQDHSLDIGSFTLWMDVSYFLLCGILQNACVEQNQEQDIGYRIFENTLYWVEEVLFYS